MIVTMNKLLKYASERKVAVGAFGIANMEILIGTIKAAEQKNLPLIVQIAQARLKHCPLDYIGPMMVEAAKNAKVDVAVHFDHGITVDMIRKSLELGFTSVMFDGSKLPLEENIKTTKEVVKMARDFNASVEAELGVVGGNEGLGNQQVKYTDVQEAIRFCDKTNVDALAIAIGNAHGEYKGKPNLNFHVLSQINKSVDTPLVLHGGSGISDLDFQKTIKNGIRKVNIATANLQAFIRGCEDYLDSNEKYNYFEMNEKIIDSVKKSNEHLLDVFNFNI